MSEQAAPAPAPPAHLRVHAQVVLSRALVATSFVVGAEITHGLEPELLTLARFLLATLLFLPYVAWRHGLAWPGWAALGRYAAISAALVVFFWSMFEALRLTSALNTAAIYTLVPGIAAGYAALLVGERLGWRRLVAILLGAFGALWVVFRGDVDRALALQLNAGDLIFFGGCLAMGLYTPLVGRLHRGEPAAVMAFWTLATGSVWLLLLSNVAVLETDWTAVAVEVYAGIAWLAVFTTLLTFFILQHATLHIGPTRVMSYGYLNPAFVVLLEWPVLGALPSARTLLGVGVIVVATFVVQWGAGRRA